MIKKIVILLVALLPFVVDAQVTVGGWRHYTPFTGVEDIQETSTYVYYLSSGTVYRVDKQTLEVTSLNSAGLVNDINATGIYLDNDAKSILVTYSTGNMDRIYDNGKVVNIPDIRDANLTGDRTINDVAFGPDNFYVATVFGLITYNGKKNEVRESLYSSLSIDKVCANTTTVLIYTNRQLKFADINDKFTSEDKFQLFSSYTRQVTWQQLHGFGSNNFLAISGSELYTFTVDVATQAVTNTYLRDDNGQSISKLYNRIGQTADVVYAINASGIHTFSKSTGERGFVALPREDAQTALLNYNGSLADMWEGDTNGLRNVNYSDASNPQLIHDNITGSELSLGAVHRMHVGNSGKIYLYNIWEQRNLGFTLANPQRSIVNVLQDGKITDVSAIGVDKENSHANGSNPEPRFIASPLELIEDPTDPDAYYIGTLFEGCFRVKNKAQTHKYYKSNAPLDMVSNYYCDVAQPLVDNYGNLWLYSFLGSNVGESVNRIMALPANKRMSTDVTIDDWTVINVPGYTTDFRECFGLACRHSNYLVFAPGRWSMALVIVDTKGTATLADDTAIYVTTYVDQDNKQLSFSHVMSLLEDNDGKLWVGTNSGVFEITDLSKVTSSTVTVNHLKVPRNDGTNLADYLLDAQVVSGMCVDGSNRKWISTNDSGAYLVNESGTEILEHYTASNSILPNQVYSVACDPNSNKVYFGSASGLMEYSSTTAPGQSSYDDVYAYPNPVRPDYTGWITISGLMDNSLVKIADAAGNVFHQGVSNGGMYTWDGCNAKGERVKTGVYYVFASQNASGSASSCVTKIMVVR